METKTSESLTKEPLAGYQKKYLRGVAHNLKPVVLVGQKGPTQALITSVNEALTAHELIKVRFVDTKDRVQKEKIIRSIAQETKSHVAGTVGHTAIYYRPHPDKEKRRIVFLFWCVECRLLNRLERFPRIPRQCCTCQG